MGSSPLGGTLNMEGDRMSKRGVLFDREKIVREVSAASSQTDALRRLGLKPHSSNYARLREACARFNVLVPSPAWSSGSPFDDGRVDPARAVDTASSCTSLREALHYLGLTKSEKNARHLSDLLESKGARPLPMKSRGAIRSDVEMSRWAVLSSSSAAHALRKLGLSTASKNYRSLNLFCEEEGISTDEMYSSQDLPRPNPKTPVRGSSYSDLAAKRVVSSIRSGKTLPEALRSEGIASTRQSKSWAANLSEEAGLAAGSPRPRSSEEILVENSTASRSTLKKAALESDLIPSDLCWECSMSPEWNNKPLTFQLDHRDGDTTNNDPSNLRFLCPNCHSQTETYCRSK